MVTAGSICFGIVIGWITYRTLRRKDGTGLSDIAGVIGAIGGAIILGIFKTQELFASYSVGLFIGFFAYLIVVRIIGEDGVGKWMEK